MRTLKKSLALVLALVMVLGLGVVGASADNKLDSYTDAGKIGDAYVEAVGVLTGLGIVDGRTDTEIVPEATYNRAEAAKIIAYMLLGKDQADALKATVAPFEDVSVDFWAAGYIAYCAELGIISGMTETTFEPYGTLTGYQWAKMLLVAVGYGKNGEFEGDSWSLNTATVVAKTGLNEGDLAAADHVALRREQAMLFAFNALNLKQVTYSPNSTNYVYDIWGYVFADGTGTTLGEEVYDLASVEGQIVDNEGMGNANTIVDPVNKWAKEVTIDANTDYDLMWHAVRVWYVDGKTNTAVYVNDLATTTAYECMATADGQKAADKLGAKVEDKTIGDTAANLYESYLVDNSALDLAYDYAYVTVYASFGTRGYADAVKDTTVINRVLANGTPASKAVDNDVIYTDISKIAQGDGIVTVVADSEKDGTDEAWHVWATTVTNGVIKSIQKENGTVVSVTLEDGTVLPLSTLTAQSNREDPFVIGNVYNYILDTHGDIIYATRNGARTLYAYTGDSRDVTGTWTTTEEFRFLNVTDGEELVAPVVFMDNGRRMHWVARGMYFDISATTDDNGRYVAERINIGDNTYAAGYIVDNYTAVRTNTDSSRYWLRGESGPTANDVYFNPETVTFIVATGRGDSMTKQTYTGIQALMDAYDVATNGVIEFNNAALTVSETSTGDWNASVVFLFADSLRATSLYVFIPDDISIADDWSELTGNPASLTAAYTGAYLEGKPFTVYLDYNQIVRIYGTNGTIERGFYAVTYTPANDRYWLGERVDGIGGCYYDNVQLHDSGYGTWYFDSKFGDFTVKADEVTIVDLSKHGIGANDLSGLHYWLEYQGHDYNPVSAAFTVNPYTNRVDYIYVVNAGWDAKITISLSDELKAAGWKIVDGVELVDEIVLTDDAAYAAQGKSYTAKLYNENLKTVSFTGGTLNMTSGEAGAPTVTVTNGALTEGKLEATWTVEPIRTTGNKTLAYELDGLVIGDITVTVDAAKGIKVVNGTYENVVLGETLTVAVKKADNKPFAGPTIEDGCKLSHYNWTCDLTSGGDTLKIENGAFLNGSNKHEVDFTFNPYHLSGTYTITNDNWVHTAATH